MSEPAKLTVGFSSLAERVANIQVPEFSFSTEVLISVQNPNLKKYALPDSLVPLKVLESVETGVAKSRNVVLDNASAKYVVFADDDARVLATGVEEVVEYLDQHGDCDVVLATTVNEYGELRKKYSPKPKRLHLFNSAKVGTIEMVVRVDSIKKFKVRFDKDFGAGSENRIGDEYVFISDLLKAGGKGMFLPIAIASHSATSSGHSEARDENLMARAKVFSRVFGVWSPFIRVVFYLRRHRRNFNIKEFSRFIVG